MNARDKILSLTNDGLAVFRHYIDPSLQPKRKIRNPLYADTNASCHIALDPKTQKYFLYDFGDPDYCGDCFWFVAELNNLDIKRDFRQVIQIIIRDLNLPIDKTADSEVRVRQYVAYSKAMPSHIYKASSTQPKKYDYKIKEWDDATLRYWMKYGILPEVLERYNVVALSSFSSVGEKGKYSYAYSTVSPIYAYAAKKHMKLYRPFAENRFQWAGQKPSTYVFGFQQLPQQGDMVIITGGEKDVLSLASHGFNAICFNSETATIPESTIEVLSLRFKHIIIMYDCDETGKRAMAKAAESLSSYDLVTIELPLSGSKTDKDISDFFAAGRTAEDLHKIIVDAFEEIDPEVDMMVDACEVDIDKPPVPSTVVISTEGVPIGTYGNLMCVTGGSGTGKSNFVSSLMAGAMAVDTNEKVDTLGFDIAPNKDYKAILLFDTEQSDYQLYKNTKRSLQRINLDSCPSYFHSFFVTIHNRRNRLRVIKRAIDRYHHKHGGVHMVVIDGIADLVNSANDETECIRLVDELQRIAGQYNTCVVCVLHYIPNGLKLRGHLGSELQRKASGIIAVEKENDRSDFSIVKATKVRDGNPLEVPIWKMVWDKGKNFFVCAGKKTEEEKARRKSADLLAIAKDMFQEKSEYTYTELWNSISKTFDVSVRTAKEYVSQMYNHKYIYKKGDFYILKNSTKEESDETN